MLAKIKNSFLDLKNISLKDLKIFAQLTLFFLTLAFLIRVLFFYKLSPNDILSTHFKEVIHSFILGMRFDLSGICYVLFGAYLLTIFNLTKSSLLYLKIFFTIWLTLHLIDIGYYQFYNDRLNILFFGFFEDDTWALIKTMWKNYPAFQIIIAFVIFNYLSFKIIEKIWFKKINKTPMFLSQNLNLHSIPFINKANLFIIFPLLALMGRGTFNLFPLGQTDTVISSNIFINTFAYGTVHSFFRAVKLKKTQLGMSKDEWKANLKNYGYDKNPQLLLSDFSKTHPEFNSNLEKLSPNEIQKMSEAILNQNSTLSEETFKKIIMQKPLKSLFESEKNADYPHVVLIVMESWAGFVFYDSTESFNVVSKLGHHIQSNVFFPYMLPNTQATIGSLSCLLSGLQQRPISSFLTESIYLKTSFFTSPAKYFKNLNYKTRFIYGGNPGWRDINKFTLTQGFDLVEGEYEIKKKLTEKKFQLQGSHDWGVFDEDLFQYVNVVLKEEKDPQLIVVMTTTNHPPYELPKNYQTVNELKIENYKKYNELLDKDLSQKRFNTFLYSNEKLAEFLNHYPNTIKTNNEKDNQLQTKRPTLIAVTGDHGFRLRNYLNTEYLEKNAVPFYIHLNKEFLNNNNIYFNQDQFSSQINIWPTLYSLISNNSFYSMGSSLLSHEKRILPTWFYNGESHILSNSKAVLIQNKNEFSTFYIENNKLKPISNNEILTKNEKEEFNFLFLKYKSEMSFNDLLMKSSLDQSHSQK